MITELQFKGLSAVKIENEKIKIIVIPELGGKIVSLIKKDKNFEIFFQNKNDIYLKPELYADFGEFDASGFDDCFPSVDSSIVNVNGVEIKYPDHGEIWSSPMKHEITDNALKLCCDSGILSYTYEKKVSLDGDLLCVDYKISNTGSEPFPCIWTMHGLMNCEEDMEIFFPEGTCSVINVQKSKIFGDEGNIYSFPAATLTDGSVYQLNKIKSKNAEKTEKFYVNGDLSLGECGVYYPTNDLSCRIYFEKDKLPYLGLWITEGGFRGDYNFALEPSTGFYDSIGKAEKNHKLQSLHPGENLEFQIKIEITNGKYKNQNKTGSEE